MGKLERLRAAIDKFKAWMSDCSICPHECSINRLKGEKGFCRVLDRPFISSYGPHFGEERELVSVGGSGTIFFAACNLACCFCQNYDISQLDRGREVSTERLSDIMLELQERGCENINLVTPTHQLYQILLSYKQAFKNGLELPLVYNCGGYEKKETIEALEGIVDIYMPDFKWSSDELGKKYSGVSDYYSSAAPALREMHRQVGELKIDSAGKATSGLLIRHLVMPGISENSRKIIDFIASELSPDTYVNIMAQYRPAYEAVHYPEINMRLSMKEYKSVLDYARSTGLSRGF